MKESLDVVNEEDEVLRKESREKVHEEKLLHRGVTIFIFKDDSKSEVLLQMRSSTKDIAPAHLSFCDGHVQTEESYDEAAIREVQEELFHDIDAPEINLSFVGKYRKSADGEEEFKALYEWVYPGPFSLQPEEVESYEFISVASLENDMEASPHKYSQEAMLNWKKYQEMSNNSRTS